MLNRLYEDIPEYYPSMHLDGYTPEQILMAQRKSMIEGHRESEKTTEIVISAKENTK